MNIQWTPPEPRPGLPGAWDRFIGPGTRPAELGLALAASVLPVLVVLWNAARQDLGWSTLQTAAAAVIAFDLFGGVVVNSTNSAKRWYHRPGQHFRHYMVFVGLHLHPFLVGFLFIGGIPGWLYGLWAFAFLIIASAAVLRLPVYLQRPASLGLTLLGFLIGWYALPEVPGLEWFLPVFYLKLLVAHIVREAPFTRL